jgi:hypothetical protein
LRAANGICLGGENIAGNQQVIVVLDVEQPAVTNVVGHPDRLTVLSPILNEALVALDPSTAKCDNVSLLERSP